MLQSELYSSLGTWLFSCDITEISLCCHLFWRCLCSNFLIYWMQVYFRCNEITFWCQYKLFNYLFIDLLYLSFIVKYGRIYDKNGFFPLQPASHKFKATTLALMALTPRGNCIFTPRSLAVYLYLPSLLLLYSNSWGKRTGFWCQLRGHKFESVQGIVAPSYHSQRL